MSDLMPADQTAFTFIAPGDLGDGVVRLQLVETRPAEPEKGTSPCYVFHTCNAGKGEVVGNVRLRVGSTEDLLLYAGHIGYGIRPEYLWHRFAARAVRLLIPLALRHGMSELWTTCDPENIASRRTCELAGAEFVEIVDLPLDIDTYRDGERHKCRYRLQLPCHARTENDDII